MPKNSVLYFINISKNYFRAGNENRTRISSLEGWSTNHCAMPAKSRVILFTLVLSNRFESYDPSVPTGCPILLDVHVHTIPYASDLDLLTRS